MISQVEEILAQNGKRVFDSQKIVETPKRDLDLEKNSFNQTEESPIDGVELQVIAVGLFLAAGAIMGVRNYFRNINKKKP